MLSKFIRKGGEKSILGIGKSEAIETFLHQR